MKALSSAAWRIDKFNCETGQSIDRLYLQDSTCCVVLHGARGRSFATADSLHIQRT